MTPPKLPTKPPSRSAPKLAAANPWHAVAVVGGKMTCTAASQMRGVRFLSAQAPRVPLPQCTWPMSCTCVYRHFDDRRANLRRGADRGMYGRPVSQERRVGHDRRRADD